MKSLFQKERAAPMLFERLPSEVASAHAGLDRALGQRADLLQRQAEAAAQEPSLARAADLAAAEHDRAETDLSLATDENFDELTQRRDAAAIAAGEARGALNLVRRRQRGIDAKLVEVLAVIEAAEAVAERGRPAFRAELRARYRQHLLLPAVAELARVLRTAFTIEGALPASGLSILLKGIIVPDIIPQPGRPVPYLLQEHRTWLDDEVALAGDHLGELGDDPEMVALHEMLRPLGQTERAAALIVRDVQKKRHLEEETARLSAPPQPRPKAPPDPTLAMSDEEYRAYRAAEVNANRVYPAPSPNPPSYVGFRRFA